MNIKGIDNLNSNYKAKPSEKNSSLKNQLKTSRSHMTEKVELSNIAVNSRIRNSMQKMKGIQNRISRSQSYLDSLNKAMEKLVSRKSMAQLYQEMTNVRNNATFNNKPLLNDMIPVHKEFFKSYDNIKPMKNKISNEIGRTKKNIKLSQHQLNRHSISIENMKASLNSRDIKQMQNLLNKNMLLRNFNKGNVISLMS